MLLLDEIEKAHADVFNILLQILDDGRLTDAQGRTVDFKNTVVIMTSNLGADRIQAHARTGESFEELKDDLMEILQQSFRPEFLNRIDEIIVFRALAREQLAEITRLLLDRVRRRLRAQDIEPEFTDAAVEHLAEVGFDPEFGARPLRRAIQRRARERALAHGPGRRTGARRPWRVDLATEISRSRSTRAPPRSPTRWTRSCAAGRTR